VCVVERRGRANARPGAVQSHSSIKTLAEEKRVATRLQEYMPSIL